MTEANKVPETKPTKAKKAPAPRLGWKDLNRLGKSDNKMRWYPHPDLYEYFQGIRSPSAAWPHSYAKAAMTIKFYKWLKENHPKLVE
jgi:hypothetical protein